MHAEFAHAIGNDAYDDCRYSYCDCHAGNPWKRFARGRNGSDAHICPRLSKKRPILAGSRCRSDACVRGEPRVQAPYVNRVSRPRLTQLAVARSFTKSETRCRTWRDWPQLPSLLSNFIQLETLVVTWAESTSIRPTESDPEQLAAVVWKAGCPDDGMPFVKFLARPTGGQRLSRIAIRSKIRERLCTKIMVHRAEMAASTWVLAISEEQTSMLEVVEGRPLLLNRWELHDIPLWAGVVSRARALAPLA